MNTESALHAVTCSAVKSNRDTQPQVHPLGNSFGPIYMVLYERHSCTGDAHQGSTPGFPAGALTTPPGAAVDLLKRN